MMTADPPEEQQQTARGDSLDYVMTAGLPKTTEDDPPLAAPKSIAFRASREGYEDSDVVTDSVIVLGDIAVGSAAKVVSVPVVNYTVLHDPPGDGSYAFLSDALSVSGIVVGMQMKIDDTEVPVYPSPWSAERSVDGFAFSDTIGVDTPFRDMRSKGLLGTRSTMPSAAHFSYSAVAEGAVGAGLVALGPAGYVLQLVKLGGMTASLAPETYPVGRGIVQYEVSPGRALETPSGDEIPDLLGPGKGDIYFGEGWTLGLQTKYRMGVARDATAVTPVWRLTTEQIDTYDILERSNQYVYCTRDIENIITDLNRTISDPRTDPEEREKLEAASGTWAQLLNANLAYVWHRDYVSQGKPLEEFLDGPGASLDEDKSETLIFSAGPTFEYSRAIVNSSLAEAAYGVAVESGSEMGHEFEAETGFKLFGTGASIKLTIGSTAGIGTGASYGAAWESGTVAEQSVGFVLNDDDVGDNISTRVYADPRWGTPIFFQDAGSYTSDPWEMGTNKNVDVAVELLEEPEEPFDYHEGAHYLVKVRYTGQRVLETATVDFTIYEYPQLDVGNMTARFNGNRGPYDLPLTKQEPSVVVAVSLYPPAGDLDNSFAKEYSVGIEVDEIADPSQICPVLTLTPTFADLRAPRATVVAPYPGQRISPVFFPAESPFKVQVVSEDTDVAKIQLQIRGKQPDGVWEPWRNLPGMAWVEGADSPGVSVFDRLDRRPPRREFTFEWQESSIRSLGVGEYALQAIATDKATPDANTDIAPPFVVFRVDEAKPSVLSTLPDYQARDSERMYRGELSVTFTDDMRPTDFDDRTMEVLDLLDHSTRVSGYVSYSPALRKVVFVPVVPFQPNGFYQVLVKTDEDTDGDGVIDRRGVHDLAGNPLDNAFSWTFRTTEAPFEPTWSMEWSADDGQGRDGNKVAAVEYGAEDGLDEKDARAVPGLAAQLHLGFVDRDQRVYERDIRPADGRLSHHWFMVVDHAALGATVTLKWQPSIRLIRSTRDYQEIRLVEFDASGQVTNTIDLDPTLARLDEETGLIEPLVAYTYTSGGEPSRYFRLDVQRTGSVTSRLTAGTSGWKFLSVPITPQVAEPFVNLGDDIDPFRLYQYDTDIAGYRIYPFDLGYVGVAAGRGYFTRLEEDVDVDVGGSSNHTDVTQALATPGWHAIGNPFLLDVPVAGLSVNGQSFDAAVSTGAVEGTLYRWDTVSPEDVFMSGVPNSDGYKSVSSGDQLEPWQGYWLRTRVPNVVLRMPAPFGIELVQPPTPAYLQPPITKPALAEGAPGPGEFELSLEMRSSGASDLSTRLGAGPGSQAGRDALDESEPPILGNTVAAYFSQLDWGDASGQYNTDFRAPLQVGETQTWIVTALAASEAGDVEPAELSWRESVARVPGDIVLHLRPLDRSGGCDACESEWLDMRAAAGVSLPPSRLTVARYEVRAERIGLLPPQAVKLEAGEEQVTLRWQPDGRQEVAGYTVRRHPGVVSDWDRERAECIELEQLPVALVSEFVDADAAGGASYTYEVATRYRSGAEAAAELQSITSLAGVERTSLLQSFPNPANPGLWIPYELEREAAVRIDIYNTAGQLVRTLDRGLQARGRYVGSSDAAYWDGRDKSGVQVGSGVYLYQLVAGDYFETRRMVLLQ
ncbi:FlgD immunoglobulin-like domain containing protein [Candidatus Latescibacterota bacterium]